MEKSQSILDNGTFILMAILTMGLAPFFPEPHIWGKLLWLAGGGKGMQLMDYLDFLMHGAPWFLGILYLYRKFAK